MLVGGLGDDILNGGAGNDTVSYASAVGSIGISLVNTGFTNTGSAGNDKLISIENVIGSNFNDSLFGKTGSTLIGGLGNDLLAAGIIGNVIRGVVASYITAKGGVSVSLGIESQQNTINAGLDTLRFIDILTGSQFNDVLTGNASANTLEGALGNDIIDGNEGGDTTSYKSATGGVIVNLGIVGIQNTVNAGKDTLISIENIIGSNFDDVLIGNKTNNGLRGSLGNDVLNGGDGRDVASYADAKSSVTVDLRIAEQQNTLAAGFDTLISIEGIIGSSFNDTLIGNEVDNFFHGGKGNDTINGNEGSDTVSYSNATSVSINLANSLQQNTFGAGLDTLIDIENLIGSNFADLLTGNAEDNLLVGGLGSNRLNGGGGNDTVSYTFAHKAITGSLVSGIVRTTSGIGVEVDDRLTSIENLTGTYFDDNLFGNIGNNILNGSSGIDTVSYEFAKGGVTVNLGIIGQQNTIQAGFDSLISIENLTGSDFNDTLIGNSGNNLLVGGLGNDVLKGSGGIDTVSYQKPFQGNSENVLVDLSITTQQNIGIYGFDTLMDIENVNGTSQNDTLMGNSEDNVLNGEGGNDILNGKDGNDTLIGGSGSIFVFDTGLNEISNNDKIQSFSNVSNEIHLDNAIFTQLTILGKLSAENFVSGVNAIALDSNDFIIFDLEHNDKGTLYYDADGSGAGKQVEFVTLTGVFETFRFNPLTANEFFII